MSEKQTMTDELGAGASACILTTLAFAAYGLGSLVASVSQSYIQTKRFADYCRKQLAPIVETVTAHQVKPGDLEIKIKDIDHDGEKEAILQVQGEKYLMRVDTEGRTQLLKYRVEEVKPVQPGTRRIITEHEPEYQTQK